MDCRAYCTAASYKIKPLFEVLSTNYKATLYRDVIHVETEFNGASGDVFFFPYGSVVFWGFPEEEELKLLDDVRDLREQPLDEIEKDEFTFLYGDYSKVVADEIVLTNREPLTKLAISHGVAQSVKLISFETLIQKTYNSTKSLPEDLARRGKIPLSKKEIRRKMGELFIERNSINLHVDVLDVPEFFWEYPELEPLYRMIANYLDIQKRVDSLNHRLDVVHELFQMLGSELNHQHSSRLEWTIIWLIIIEVVLTLLRDVFGFL